MFQFCATKKYNCVKNIAFPSRNKMNDWVVYLAILLFLHRPLLLMSDNNKNNILHAINLKTSKIASQLHMRLNKVKEAKPY